MIANPNDGNGPRVEVATPMIDVSAGGLITATTEQEKGYVPGGTKSATQQLTTQGAKTVTPGTSNQTAVASGRYTTGDVVVAGDANLVPENIAEGVSIFGVQGAHSGGGGSATVTFICETGAYSDYDPTIGIFIITPEGQPQQINLDVGETKIVQVAANSFMFPALNGDWGGASEISGNAYMVENAQFYTMYGYKSHLLYVYGDCTINV